MTDKIIKGVCVSIVLAVYGAAAGFLFSCLAICCVVSFPGELAGRSWDWIIRKVEFDDDD